MQHETAQDADSFSAPAAEHLFGSTTKPTLSNPPRSRLSGLVRGICANIAVDDLQPNKLGGPSRTVIPNTNEAAELRTARDAAISAQVVRDSLTVILSAASQVRAELLRDQAQLCSTRGDACQCIVT